MNRSIVWTSLMLAVLGVASMVALLSSRTGLGKESSGVLPTLQYGDLEVSLWMEFDTMRSPENAESLGRFAELGNRAATFGARRVTVKDEIVFIETAAETIAVPVARLHAWRVKHVK